MDVNAALSASTLVVLAASYLGYHEVVTIEPPASDDETSVGQPQPFAFWSSLGGPACSLLCGLLVARFARRRPATCDATTQTEGQHRSALAAAPQSSGDRFSTPPRWPREGGGPDDESTHLMAGVASSVSEPVHSASTASSRSKSRPSSHHRRTSVPVTAGLTSPLDTSLRNRSR